MSHYFWWNLLRSIIKFIETANFRSHSRLNSRAVFLIQKICNLSPVPKKSQKQFTSTESLTFRVVGQLRLSNFYFQTKVLRLTNGYICKSMWSSWLMPLCLEYMINSNIASEHLLMSRKMNNHRFKYYIFTSRINLSI